MYTRDITYDNTVAEVVRDIIKIVREDSVPLPVLLNVRKELSEYETPTKYDTTLSMALLYENEKD